MNYTEFDAGNETYKLRLNTRDVISLEKRLGCNPLAIFGDGDTIPTITTMVNILHCSLTQYQHGIKMEDAYTIFDRFLEDGNAMTDFIPVILEIYKVSGLIKDEPAKNS